jgi:hypothetical protein
MSCTIKARAKLRALFPRNHWTAIAVGLALAGAVVFVITWQLARINRDDPPVTVLWFCTVALIGATDAALRKARRVAARRRPGLPVEQRDVAMRVAETAQRWSPEQITEFCELHDSGDATDKASDRAAVALVEAGRMDDEVQAVWHRLIDVGGNAVDVFLAVLTADLIPWKDWERLTRWWRAAGLAELPSPRSPHWRPLPRGPETV